jgi:hypothetical protein
VAVPIRPLASNDHRAATRSTPPEHPDLPPVAGIMGGDGDLPPLRLPGLGPAASSCALPDLPPHDGAPARRCQRGPDRALPPLPCRGCHAAGLTADRTRYLSCGSAADRPAARTAIDLSAGGQVRHGNDLAPWWLAGVTVRCGARMPGATRPGTSPFGKKVRHDVVILQPLSGVIALPDGTVVGGRGPPRTAARARCPSTGCAWLGRPRRPHTTRPCR